VGDGRVEIAKAKCSCLLVLFHLPACERSPAEARRIFVDTEDGCVWLRVGDTVAPMTPQAARELGDQLHICAREAIRG